MVKWIRVGLPITKYKLSNAREWALIQDTGGNPRMFRAEAFIANGLFSDGSQTFPELRPALDWCESKVLISAHEKMRCAQQRKALGLP